MLLVPVPSLVLMNTLMLNVLLYPLVDFLVLSQHPERVLFRDVRTEVRLGTLDLLIETMKRLTDRV